MSAASFIHGHTTRAGARARISRSDENAPSGSLPDASVATRVAGSVPVQSEFYAHRFGPVGLPRLSSTPRTRRFGQ